MVGVVRARWGGSEYIGARAERERAAGGGAGVEESEEEEGGAARRGGRAPARLHDELVLVELAQRVADDLPDRLQRAQRVLGVVELLDEVAHVEPRLLERRLRLRVLAHLRAVLLEHLQPLLGLHGLRHTQRVQGARGLGSRPRSR